MTWVVSGCWHALCFFTTPTLVRTKYLVIHLFVFCSCRRRRRRCFSWAFRGYGSPPLNRQDLPALDFYRLTTEVQLAICNGVVLSWREKVTIKKANTAKNTDNFVLWNRYTKYVRGTCMWFCFEFNVQFDGLLTYSVTSIQKFISSGSQHHSWWWRSDWCYGFLHNKESRDLCPSIWHWLFWVRATETLVLLTIDNGSSAKKAGVLCPPMGLVVLDACDRNAGFANGIVLKISPVPEYVSILADGWFPIKWKHPAVSSPPGCGQGPWSTQNGGCPRTKKTQINDHAITLCLIWVRSTERMIGASVGRPTKMVTFWLMLWRCMYRYIENKLICFG